MISRAFSGGPIPPEPGGGVKKSHDDPDWYDSGSSESGGDKGSSGDKGASGDKGTGSGTTVKKKAPKEGAGANAEPSFKDGMSVNDAINAVPQGLPRVNIDQEDLNTPLLEPDFYKQCKLSPSQHFTIKFAVWDGRAVGIDITTQPANKGMQT